MKSRILLLACIVGFGLQSCQSEYGERMSKALELKKQYEQVESTMNGSGNPVLKVQLGEIKKEIKFQAMLSGNEGLFLEQIWSN